jgi:hypothetical protein
LAIRRKLNKYNKASSALMHWGIAAKAESVAASVGLPLHDGDKKADDL